MPDPTTEDYARAVTRGDDFEKKAKTLEAEVLQRDQRIRDLAGEVEALTAEVGRLKAGQPTGTTPAAGRSAIGVNLEHPDDDSRSQYFIDLMRQARRFGSVAKPWNEAAPVGPDGWPTTDFGVCLMTDDPAGRGTYTVVVKGRFTKLGGAGEGGVGVSMVGTPSFDANTGTTIGLVKVNPPEGQNVSLYLTVAGTENGVRGMKVLRPGYSDRENGEQIFTDNFIALLAPFGGFRAMDWQRTNGSTITTWASRPTLDTPSWATLGVPYEVVIALANLTNKAAWVCIPDMADADHLAKAAILFAGTLAADVPLYLESSNECWNFQFAQAGRQHQASKAKVAAGGSMLNEPAGDENQWRHRYHARRTIEIGRAFRAAFLVAGRDPSRVRPVLGYQFSNPGQVKDSLAWLARHYGPPAADLYAVAGAPYFGDWPNMAEPGLTADAVAAHMLNSASPGPKTRASLAEAKAAAEAAGLKWIAYEFGVDLGKHKNDVPAKVAAQTLPSAGEAVGRNVTELFGLGTAEGYYYLAAYKPNVNGYWGLSDRADDVGRAQPKFAALAQFAASNPPG